MYRPLPWPKPTPALLIREVLLDLSRDQVSFPTCLATAAKTRRRRGSTPRLINMLYRQDIVHIWDICQIRQDTCILRASLRWCHLGYISGYIRIRVSWTVHHDTSVQYIRIHRDAKSRHMYMYMYLRRDTCTCGIQSEMHLECIQRST